ncbi:hypothetical protein [Chondromyces crocatus]|nr:hypothetical protein [Chondromyces crocatus]
MLAALPEGERLLVDITRPDTGFIIEYLDASLLDRVLVRSHRGEYVLSVYMASMGIEPNGTAIRIVLASDPELQADIAQGRVLPGTEPSADGKVIVIICGECHSHGEIIHCTGCIIL